MSQIHSQPNTYPSGEPQHLSATNNDDVTSFSTTDFNGNANFTFSSANRGATYTATVENVTKGGWTYEFSSNVETSDSITL